MRYLSVISVFFLASQTTASFGDNHPSDNNSFYLPPTSDANHLTSDDDTFTTASFDYLDSSTWFTYSEDTNEHYQIVEEEQSVQEALSSSFDQQGPSESAVVPGWQAPAAYGQLQHDGLQEPHFVDQGHIAAPFDAGMSENFDPAPGQYNHDLVVDNARPWSPEAWHPGPALSLQHPGTYTTYIDLAEVEGLLDTPQPSADQHATPLGMHLFESTRFGRTQVPDADNDLDLPDPELTDDVARALYEFLANANTNNRHVAAEPWTNLHPLHPSGPRADQGSTSGIHLQSTAQEPGRRPSQPDVTPLLGMFAAQLLHQWIPGQATVEGVPRKKAPRKKTPRKKAPRRKLQSKRNVRVVTGGPGVPTCGFQCGKCRRVFASQEELDEHQQQPCKRRYPCSMCQKDFADVSGLRKHENRHTRARIWCCPFCSKESVRAWEHKRHLKKHKNSKALPPAPSAASAAHSSNLGQMQNRMADLTLEDPMMSIPDQNAIQQGYEEDAAAEAEARNKRPVQDDQGPMPGYQTLCEAYLGRQHRIGEAGPSNYREDHHAAPLELREEMNAIDEQALLYNNVNHENGHGWGGPGFTTVSLYTPGDETTSDMDCDGEDDDD